MREDDIIKIWKERGHNVLDEKYWNLWDEVVPIRVSDLYGGVELGACLEIIEKLNKNCSYNDALEIINRQKHSGIFYSLVCALVAKFCDRGKEFMKYVN